MKEAFAFIILHYQSIAETQTCMEAILKIDYENLHIVVVDNHSDKGQIEKIQSKFRDRSRIHYIRTGKNYGYARGNNIGMYYAKYTLNARYICVCNPDITIKDALFVHKCMASYQNDPCAVMGPDIIDWSEGEQRHISPMYGAVYNRKRLLAGIGWSIRLSIVRWLEQWAFVRSIVKWKHMILKQNRKTERPEREKTKNERPADTFVLNQNDGWWLSGACLVFTPAFLKLYDGFFPKTFLYCEEVILKYICYQLGLKWKFQSDISVYHNENDTEAPIDYKWMSRREWIGAKSSFWFLYVVMHRKKRQLIKMISHKDIPQRYDYKIM